MIQTIPEEAQAANHKVCQTVPVLKVFINQVQTGSFILFYSM